MAPRSGWASIIPTTRQRFPPSAPQRARRWWPTWRNARPISAFTLIPEVLVLQRKIGDRFPHERDRILQLVALGAGDAQRITLDRRLHLELAVFHELDDLLGQLLLDAGTDGHRLFHLVAGDLLEVAVLERAHVDLPLGELGGQDIGHLFEL